MKSVLMVFLLIATVATQPLLAIPASCQMPGKCPTASCAKCCAVTPCCAPSDQQQSSPLTAVVKSTGDFVPAIMAQPVAVPLPVVRHIQYPKIARLFADAHAPSPLALNCIQLI